MKETILLWALSKSSVILEALSWLRVLTRTLISVSGSSRAPKGLKRLITNSFSESAELTPQMLVPGLLLSHHYLPAAKNLDLHDLRQRNG